MVIFNIAIQNTLDLKLLLNFRNLDITFPGIEDVKLLIHMHVLTRQKIWVAIDNHILPSVKYGFEGKTCLMRRKGGYH